MSTTNSIKESISLLREIAKTNNLGDAISAKINELADYLDSHSNIYDYTVTERAVTIMNNLYDDCYNYTVNHYGKEVADKCITLNDIHLDADEEYNRLMKNVCF